MKTAKQLAFLFFIISNFDDNNNFSAFATLLDFDKIFSADSFLHESFIVTDSIQEITKVPSWVTTRQVSFYNLKNNTEVTEMWRHIKTSSMANNSLVVFIHPDNDTVGTEILEKIKILEQMKLIYRKPTYFIVWPDYFNETTTERMKFHSQGLPLDCAVYLVYKINSTSPWNTIEIYSIKSKSFVQAVKFESKTIEESQLLRKTIRRSNFEKAAIIAVQYVSSIYQFINVTILDNMGKNYSTTYQADINNKNYSETKNNQFYTYNCQYGNFEIEIYHYLRDSFNFSEAAIDGTGYAAREGNAGDDLVGMASQVNTGDADISITSSELLPFRVFSLNFLQPTYVTHMWAYFIQPPSSAIRDIFLHSFTLDLWLAILSTWLLIVLGMISLAWVKSLTNDLHEDDKTIWEDCMLWATGTFCQQGWHVCPESTSMKILFIFSLFTGLLSYIAYSAALVSMLSSKVVPVRSVDDLVDFKYFIYRDNLTYHTLFALKELERRNMIPILPREERSILPEGGISKIYSEKCTFFTIPDNFYPAIASKLSTTASYNKEICEQISKISVNHRPVLGGMFVRRGSPLKESFNHRLAIIHERGLRFRLLENYYWENTVQCLQKGGVEKESLGIFDVFTAFIVLILGHCLSVIIFIIEKMFPPKFQIHVVMEN